MTEIIKAGLGDLQTIRQMANKIWPFTYGEILSVDQLEYMLEWIYSIDSLTEQMQILHHEFYLAVENKEKVGYISLARMQEDPSIYVLHKIYVLPEAQGKKIGKALLNFAIEQVTTRGGKALQLNVNRHNKALHFYEKQGFNIILEEDIDIGNGYFMNDYRMQLEMPVREES